jgi:flagellar basal-body rod protein FlgG
LDLALSSDSFFAVTLSTGETVYTRDGAFRVTPDGKLVNTDGLQIRFSSGGGNITNPALTTVTDTGSVLVTGQNGNASEVGKLELKRFLNPAGLEKIGRNLYRATEASGAPQNVDTNASHVVSGFLETSNVQIADEMVKMIIAQRTYEMNSKSIQTSDDMLGIAANLKR